MEMKELERYLKALANRRRLEILRFLKKKGEAPVWEIADSIRLSVKSTSRHLAVLFGASIVDKQQRSLEVYYRCTSSVPSPIKSILLIL